MVAPIGTSLSTRSWKKGSIRRRVCVRWPVVVGPRFLIITTTKDIAAPASSTNSKIHRFFSLFPTSAAATAGCHAKIVLSRGRPAQRTHSANHYTHTRGDANNIFLKISKISKSPPKQFDLKIFRLL